MFVTVRVDLKIFRVVMVGAHMIAPTARGTSFPPFSYLLCGRVPILYRQ